MKIGIIGAGAAGLAALRYCLEQGHECVAFEQSDKVGGTWNYTDLTDVDENGIPIHSSMYQGLTTNLPKELMEYQDFHYPDMDKSYIEQKAVLTYIQQFAEHYNLYPHIKFLRQTIEVSPLPDQKWKLKEKQVKTNEITEHIFDAIMVCVGNFYTPRLPEIPGMELVGKNAMHSHYYRRTDPFKGKRVLIIGGGPSGIDIARLVGEVCEKVFLSHRGSLLFKVREYVISKPSVKMFEENRAIFEDGTQETIDKVIYCTGYHYSYPFLTPNCGIKVENNWVKYLYKHIVNVEYPSMGFIGIPIRVCVFPVFDIQVRFFLEFLKHSKNFSKEEMIADILKDVNERKVAVHQTHIIGSTFHQIYCDSLANTVNIKKLRPVIHKMYKHVTNHRGANRKYKIINDEEFIVS